MVKRNKLRARSKIKRKLSPISLYDRVKRRLSAWIGKHNQKALARKAKRKAKLAEKARRRNRR